MSNLSTGKSIGKSTSIGNSTGKSSNYPSSSLEDELFEILKTKDLISHKSWRAWYCQAFYMIKKDRVLKLAGIALSKDTPPRYFAKCLRNEMLKIDPELVNRDYPLENQPKTKQLWKSQNPPDVYGNYVCGLCHQLVSENEMTIDHILEESSHPHLRHRLSNLQPSHRECNQLKGAAYALRKEAGLEP